MEADRSAAQAEREKAAATARVRSLYMDGALGPDGRGPSRAVLLSSAVSGVTRRVAERAFEAVRRTDRERVAQQEAGASAARQRSQDAQSGRPRRWRRCGDVAAQVTAPTTRCGLAQSRVEALQGDAARLQAAEDARRRWRRRRAAAAALNASAAGRAATVHARGVPADYGDLYVRGAATWPGDAAGAARRGRSGQSGHGVNTGPSSAGAVGPMQFLPATFAAYAVDGDGGRGHRRAGPADAVFTAAAYLCPTGREGPGRPRRRRCSATNTPTGTCRWCNGLADELAAQGFREQISRPCRAAPLGAAHVSWRRQDVRPLVVLISTLRICSGSRTWPR